MVKSRDLLVKSRTGIVNQIRGFCKSEGFRLPKRSAASFARLEDDVPPAVREVAKPLFAVLKELAKKIGLYDTMIADAVKRLHGEEAALLEPIAGVGPVTAAAFLAAVGDVATFGSARDAGPYFGLVPRQDQSGQTDRQLRISKEGNEVVRRLLVTAANYIMGPFGKDCDLRRHGMRIAERGGKNAKKRAKVAVARKLAVLMLAIWKSGESWNPLHRVPAASPADAPHPVVHDECGSESCASERDTKRAPSSTTRTQPCTEGQPLTKSADGSTGRSGAPRTPAARTTKPSQDGMPGASAPARSATPSAPATPACAGGPADLASASRAGPSSKRGRFAAEGVPPSA